MIVERYIQRPRHVEVQVVGDKPRQRRSTSAPASARSSAATRRCSRRRRRRTCPTRPQVRAPHRGGPLAESIGYDSAGTVEFVVDDETGDYFFLEMNTRLQVEHPVTEEITGLDLVELQLRRRDRVEPLPSPRSRRSRRGTRSRSASTPRTPPNDFAPQTGTWSARSSEPLSPLAVRWDSGGGAGSVITPHYDSMIAKLIVHGGNRGRGPRGAGRRRWTAARIGGLVTTTADSIAGWSIRPVFAGPDASPPASSTRPNSPTDPTARSRPAAAMRRHGDAEAEPAVGCDRARRGPAVRSTIA